MLKFIVDGTITIFIIISIMFLVLGNINRFIWWVKQHKKRKEMGILYFYMNFWSDGFHEYTDKELENLQTILQEFERKKIHVNIQL